MRLAQCADVGVVIHDRRDAESRSNEPGKIEIVPASYMRRERDPLILEIDRPAKSDAAAIELILLPDTRDLLEHPIAAAFAIGRARFARNHPLVFKHSRRKLRAADIDGKCPHCDSCAACITSSGDAVPVPVF